MSMVRALFNRWWVGLWALNTVVLAALLVATVTPAVFLSAAVLLFFVPEGIGLHHRGDSMPPLTYAIRRYAPRWTVLPVIWTASAWSALAWSERPHRVFILVAIAGIAGWLTNHFDVTFDGLGE